MKLENITKIDNKESHSEISGCKNQKKVFVNKAKSKVFMLSFDNKNHINSDSNYKALKVHGIVISLLESQC